jgi:hypothetical protein
MLIDSTPRRLHHHHRRRRRRRLSTSIGDKMRRKKPIRVSVATTVACIVLLSYVAIDSTNYYHANSNNKSSSSSSCSSIDNNKMNVIFVDAFFTTTTTTSLLSQHYRDDEDVIVRQQRKRTSAFASSAFSMDLIRMMMMPSSSTSTTTTNTTAEKEKEASVTSTSLWSEQQEFLLSTSQQQLLLEDDDGNDVQVLMEPIINHPSIQLLDLYNHPRKKLKPRHKKYFGRTTNTSTNTNTTTSTTNDNGDSNNRQIALFEKLAIACCDSSVVPRKELYETYAAAILIHNQFRDSNNENDNDNNTCRIADLAAGHGLLSWMLLAIYDDYDNDTNTNNSNIPTRTAICIDLRMPPSAIAIAKSMRKHFFPILPNNDDEEGNNGDDSNDDESILYDRRWTYVQTGLQDIRTDSSTLLVSVHACGTLSDYLIEMAIQSNYAPLALVPCCHTYSIRKGYTPHPIYAPNNITAKEVGYHIEKQQQQQQQQQGNGATASLSLAAATTTTTTTAAYKNKKFQIIENVIDKVRLITLQNAYGSNNVVLQTLPEIFTERNRLFLVQKKKIKMKRNGTKTTSTTAINSNVSSDADDRDRRLSAELSDSSECVAEIPITNNVNSNPDQSKDGNLVSKPIIATTRKGSMPQPQQKVIAAAQKQQILLVPLKDDVDSIDYCVSISGTEKSYQRLRKLIPNHFTPKLDVSMWISSSESTESTESKSKSKPSTLIIGSTNTTTDINTNNNNNNVNKKENNNDTPTVEMLQEVLDDTVRNYIHHHHHHPNGLDDYMKEFDDIDCVGNESSSSSINNNDSNDFCYCSCTIRAINELYVDPKTGRVSCTYQIEYTTTPTSNNNDTIDSNSSRKSIIPPIVSSSNFLNDDGSFPKKVAKEIHELFCHKVVTAVDGVEIR